MNKPTLVSKKCILAGDDSGTSFIGLNKKDAIEILKTLSWIKKKIQPLVDSQV